MKKVIGIILLLILLFNIPAFADDGKTDYNNNIVKDDFPDELKDVEKEIMDEVNKIKEELAEEYDNIESNDPITINDREYVSEGWGGVNYTHELNSNNAYIIISQGDNHTIKITSSNHEEWKIVATGTIPGEGVKFVIYYHMSDSQKNGVYRVTVIITGEGSVPIREGFTGTGNYKIQGVRVLQYTIIGAPGDNGNGNDTGNGNGTTIPDNETNDTTTIPPENDTNDTITIPPEDGGNDTAITPPEEDGDETLVILPEDDTSDVEIVYPEDDGSSNVAVIDVGAQGYPGNNIRTSGMENTGLPIPLLVILIIVIIVAVIVVKK